MTVRELKELIAPEAEIPAEAQRLIVTGRAMKDEVTIEDYGIEENGTIHLVRAPQSTAAPASTFGSAGGRVGGRGDGGFGGIGFGGLVGQNMDPAEMQRQLMGNPEMMSAAMNSPLVRGILESPDALRNLIESNPRLRSVMDANPQLRHALSDPSVLREAMEVARSPARLREATRHQDLAMSQLENHPEGFNALRRMYQDVQEPLMDDLLPTQGTSHQPPQRRSPPPNAPPGALANPWARPLAPPPQRQPFHHTMAGHNNHPFPMPDPAMLQALLGNTSSSNNNNRPFFPLRGLADASRTTPRQHDDDIDDIYEDLIPPNPWAHIPDPTTTTTTTTTQSPMENELQQLVAMGFHDRAANLRALVSLSLF